MNFNELAAPIAAPDSAGNFNIGAGFLVKCAGQIYLVTAAHVANYELDQMAKWANWSPELILVDESTSPLARARLFDETSSVKSPLFKYLRTTSEPDRILDLLLLPLSPGEPMARMSKIFALPDEKAAYAKDDKVFMVGRRAPWPYVNLTTHVVTVPDAQIMHMEPEGKPGDSGGPVLTSAGALVGMNYGHGNAAASGAMVITSELIEIAATTTDGFVKGWTYSSVAPQGRTQP